MKILNKFKTLLSSSINFVSGNFFNSAFWFNITSFFSVFKIKMILIAVIFLYSILLIGFSYFLWKSYLFAAKELTDLIYRGMCGDITALNNNFPIYDHYKEIPSVKKIAYIYNKLGIIDYHEYVYKLSPESLILEKIYNINPSLQSKVSSVVLADIVNQHAQLFGDLAEQVLKRLFRASLPLFSAILLLTGVTIYEKINLVNTVVNVLN